MKFVGKGDNNNVGDIVYWDCEEIVGEMRFVLCLLRG